MPKTGLRAGKAPPGLCAGDLELRADLQELSHGSGGANRRADEGDAPI